MAEALDWIIVLIAGASLIFAFFAFRMVKGTTKSVDTFIDRADKFMAGFKKQAKGVFTPQFVGDTIAYTMTKGLSNEDESPVTMHQYVQTTARKYIEAYGPGLKDELKAELPRIMKYVLDPNSSPPPSGPPNPGQALVAQRGGAWGSGGLKAATKVAKASKNLPIAAKVGEYDKTAHAVVQMGGAIKELKDEVAGMFGKGSKGNGGTDQVGEVAASQGSNDWGPPF